MSSLQTAFPQTSAIDSEALSWRSFFSWSGPNLDLLDALWAAQVARMKYLPDFWKWTEAMVDDLNNARRTAVTNEERDAIDCVRFVTCMPALHATRAAGQMGACYDWIWAAIAPTHVRGKHINENTYSFLDLPYTPPDLYSLYLRHIPQFAAACFYVAYKLGGLDALTAAVARGCWMVASNFHRRDPGDDEALEAMAQIVIWAAYRNWPDGETWAGALLASGERTQSPRQQLQVAMSFTTPANRYVDGTPREWAERALREHGREMVEHERLQARSVTLEGPADWRANRSEILEEIATLRSRYVAAARSGESDLEVMELRVSIIHPTRLRAGKFWRDRRSR
jgi:hypothetical protein